MVGRKVPQIFSPFLALRRLHQCYLRLECCLSALAALPIRRRRYDSSSLIGGLFLIPDPYFDERSENYGGRNCDKKVTEINIKYIVVEKLNPSLLSFIEIY